MIWDSLISVWKYGKNSLEKKEYKRFLVLDTSVYPAKIPNNARISTSGYLAAVDHI